MSEGMKMQNEFHPVINIRESRMTMREVTEYIDRESKKHPDREYYMDGDTYSFGWRSRIVSEGVE